MNQKISEFFNKAKDKVKEAYHSTTKIQIYAFFSAFCFIFFVLALTFSILFAYKNGELVKTENNATTSEKVLKTKNKDLTKEKENLEKENNKIKNGKALKDARTANKELTNEIIGANNEIKTLTRERNTAQDDINKKTERINTLEQEKAAIEADERSTQKGLTTATKEISNLKKEKIKINNAKERAKRELNTATAEQERTDEALDTAVEYRDNFRTAIKNILNALGIDWNEKKLTQDKIFEIKNKIADMKKAQATAAAEELLKLRPIQQNDGTN